MSDVPAHVLRQAKSRDFRPSVRIGKSGLSETVLRKSVNNFRQNRL